LRRLLIRPGGIGDCILSLPALECLRTDFTEVWIRAEVTPLIRFADRVSAIASTGLDLLGLPDSAPPAGLLERFRSFDSIVSWYGSNREEFREQIARVELPFHFLAALPPAGGHIHCADFFLEQAGCSGPAVPRITLPPAPRGDFAVIQPFSGSLRKNWPLDRYRELARHLPFPVRWSAGPEEQLGDAVRMDSLWDLARWLATARIYIGNDSGITHLAAAVGTPVIAIFGPSDPAVWAPRGDRVQVVDGKLEEITVDQVLASMDKLLPCGPRRRNS
jgi:heptosyltransferase-3